MQLLDKSVGAGSDFFQKDYKMLHDTVRPFRTKTVQLPELSGKPLPGSAPRSFFALRTELLQTDFWEKKQLFQKDSIERSFLRLKIIQFEKIVFKNTKWP